jgi:hypothetical protein
VDKFKDALGIAGSGKYLYQAGRAFSGLQTTTRLTAGLDLASGAVGLSSAQGLTDVAKALSTETKGLVGAARLSEAGKIANYASKAAPIVAKGSALLGAVLGGVEMARGARALKEGKKTEVSQAGKYAHKYRAPLGQAARSVGGKMAEGAGLARKGALSAATRLKAGAQGLRAGARRTGEKIGNKVGERMDQVKDGAKACRTVLSEGLNRIKNLFD